MRTAAQHAIDLIDSQRPDVARALLDADSRATRAEAELTAYKFELAWLLRHARALEVEVTDDDDGLSIDCAAGGSYVLRDCPRLQSIMAGELPHVDRSR